MATLVRIRKGTLRVYLACIGLLGAAACGPTPDIPSAPERQLLPPTERYEAPASRAITAESARELCSAVMQRTRQCGELYLPGLLQLRVHLDRPPGIAERFRTEGEAKLLAIARAEVEQDWSEAGIAAHCEDLAQMPPEERDEVAERERSCLPVADECSPFVECHLALLEDRWTHPGPTAPR